MVLADGILVEKDWVHSSDLLVPVLQILINLFFVDYFLVLEIEEEQDLVFVLLEDVGVDAT